LWFAANAGRLTIDASMVELEAVYAAAVNGGRVRINGHGANGGPPRFPGRRVGGGECEPVAIEPVRALGTDDGNRS
jgi:hypothetical protein